MAVNDENQTMVGEEFPSWDDLQRCVCIGANMDPAQRGLYKEAEAS